MSEPIVMGVWVRPMSDERTTHEEWYRQEMARRREAADVEIPVEAGDRVRVSQVSGIPEWMLERVGGYPIEGTVIGVSWGTEGCRNLGCEAVVRVRFTQEECPAVYNGTTDIFPVGYGRGDWSEQPIEKVED